MQGSVGNERIICRLFLRHRCNRGDNCPFYHPDYNLNPDSPTVCWLNFCPDFQKGRCFQQDCRFFHVTADEEDTYKIRKDIAPSLLEQAMRKALLLDVALTGTRPTCKAFLQGGCSLPMCPYRHISRHEFANEVLNTLRNEFEVVLGQSGTDIPGTQALQNPQVNNRNNQPMINPMMSGMGQGMMAGNRNNVEDPEEKMRRLRQENEEIYRALDPNQKANSLEEIRNKLLTLQAALQWKDENDSNKGGFVDDGLPPGMAVVNYGHTDANFQEPSIDLMRRRNPMAMQQDQGDNRLGKEGESKIFIGGLDTATETEALRDYFSRFGEIVDAVVIKHKNAKKSRGFGFVTYSQDFMAENAYRNGPHMIEGKVVEIKRASPRAEESRPSMQHGRSARSPDRNEGRVRKLFIGGLNDSVTTDILKTYFCRYGTIVDAVAMTEAKTKRSRGFGFVEFETDTIAERVLADCPHKIMGLSVTVDKPVPRDAPRRSNPPLSGNRGEDIDDNKMFIGGLDFNSSERTLEDYFGRYGTIRSVKIQRDIRGQSRGYGFVVFTDKYMIKDVLDSGPHVVDGRRVDTGFASKRSDSRRDRDSRDSRDNRDSRDRNRDRDRDARGSTGERHRSPGARPVKNMSSEDSCKLYVGNIPKDLRKEQIEKYFSQFGEVRAAEMKSRGVKGYCFIFFEDPDMVEIALDAAPHEIDGVSVDVGHAVTKGDRDDKSSRDSNGHRGSRSSRRDTERDSSGGNSEECVLYVGNLNSDFNEDILSDYFCKYGEIKETRITNDDRGSSKIYAFVTFAEVASVEEALDDGPHEILGCSVNVGNAHPKKQDRRDGRRPRDRSPDSSYGSSKRRKAERSHLD